MSRPKTPSLRAKDSSGDGGFRAQLLELALKEKQKLGLDKLDSPRSSSSALKAIQGYSGTRSPEESDHEEEPIATDLYDDLPKPLFPISNKGSTESAWKTVGSKQGSSLESRRKPVDDIFPDDDEYDPRHDSWDDRRDDRRDGKSGGLHFDHRPDSHSDVHRPDSRTDLYDDLLTESHVNSRSESKHHSEDSRTQRQSSMLIPGLGIDENIDDEDAFLYGDEGLSTGRPPSGPERRPAQEKHVEERKHAPQDSWMPAPQRFGGRPPSPEDSDLTIDLKLPFDRRKGAESARPGKEFPESRAQRQEQPVPQRGGRRAPDRIFDEPSPMDSWKSSQRHRTPSPEQSSPPLSSRTTKEPPKQSMLGYSSIESMKQELRELKMMLSREKEAKEESHERKRPRTPSDAGSYNRGGRSPSPAKRRRDSYSPSHRRRGRSPPDNYRRPSPPSYRRERRESPYYRGAATPSARRYSPSPANSLSPSSDRSVGKRWSPSPPPRTPRHRRQEGRTPGRRWSPDSPPPRPRRSSLERTPKHPSSQTPYYQGSSQPTQPPYYDSGQPSGPPLVPPPNLSVPPPNFTMNAPPPQVPYFAGYPPPAQAPPDFSYPPPSTQPQQQAMRSNLRVVPLQSAVEGGPVKEETSFSPVNVKQEEKTVSKKLPPVTQEEIDHYLSLVETKDSHREKLTLLKQELVRIGKIQNEMMRRRQHKRDGHRDPSLLESSSMYEDVKKQVMEVNSQMEEVSRKIFKVSQRIKIEAIAYKKKQEEEALAAESADTAGIKFVYEDPRDHWCQQCNVLVPTMNDMFRHLHSPKHKEATPSHDRPWAEIEKPVSANQKFHRTIVSTVKGVQFLVGMSGYYCKLCKVMSGDSAMARNHLHSLEHNQNYTKYILLNPFYERRWKMERDIAMVSAIKEEKEKQEKEKQEKEREKEREKDRSRSRSRSPSEHGSSKRHKSSRKEEQEKMRRKNEELQKAERENSRAVKELDDTETTPVKGATANSPPPSRPPSGGTGIKLKLLKGQKVQKQPPKQTPVVIIGKAPCFRPSFLSGKSKAGNASNSTTKQEESKPYGPALPPNLASASSADLVEEAKKNEEAMEIPLPIPASESQASAQVQTTTTGATVKTTTTKSSATSAPVVSATQAPRKQALKSGIVSKVTSVPSVPGASLTEEDMDLKLLGIERDDIQPIAPVKPPPAYGPGPPPPVQLPNLSVPPPMFPVPPPKRTLLPSPQYLATVPPPTLAPLNVPPPTVVPLQVLRLPPPPPPDEPEPPVVPVTRARIAALQRPPPTLTPVQMAPPTRCATTTVRVPQEPRQAVKPSVDTTGKKGGSVTTTRAAPKLDKATGDDTKPVATVAGSKTIGPPIEGEKPNIQDVDVKVVTAADVASEGAIQPVTKPSNETAAVKPSDPATQSEALQNRESHKTTAPEGVEPLAAGDSLAISSVDVASETATQPVIESSSETVATESSELTTQAEVLRSGEPHEVTVPEADVPIATGISLAVSSDDVSLENAAQPVTEPCNETVAAKPSETTTQRDVLQPHEPREVTVPEGGASIHDISLVENESHADTVKDYVPSSATRTQDEKTVDKSEVCVSVQQQVSADASQSRKGEAEPYPSLFTETTEANADHTTAGFIGEEALKACENAKELHSKEMSNAASMEVMEQSDPSSFILPAHTPEVSAIIEADRADKSLEDGSSSALETAGNGQCGTVPSSQCPLSFNLSESAPISSYLGLRTGPTLTQTGQETMSALSDTAPLSNYFSLRAGTTETGQETVCTGTKSTSFQSEEFSAGKGVTADFSAYDKAHADEDMSNAENKVENIAQSSGSLAGEVSIPEGQNIEGDLCSSGDDKANADEDMANAKNEVENIVQSSGSLGGEVSVPEAQNIEGDSCSSGATEIEGDLSSAMELNCGDSREALSGEDALSHKEIATLAPEKGKSCTGSDICTDLPFGGIDSTKELVHDVQTASTTRCGQVTVEDATVAQFIEYEEETCTRMEEGEEVLDSAANAAEHAEGMADTSGSYVQLGSVSEVFGCESKAEVPYTSFEKPSSGRDCSVPVVTTLGLDSLLDDCPDWKAAILDATENLEGSMPGENLFNSASVSVEPLASATAVGGAVQDSKISEDKLSGGDTGPSSQLPPADSGEVPLEDASLGAVEPVLEDAKVSTEEECILGEDFAVVDECSDDVVQGEEDDSGMVVMDQA